LSFGVQSMATHVLTALGRTHDPANVARAIALARDAGFARVNVDLIYGMPGESLDDWRRSVEGAIALDVEHVSAYALTVEPATPLGRRVAAGARGPDDDQQADCYALVDDLLAAAGYRWYEISNWARAGEECRHNLLYWTGGEYLGIGCAAHGHTAGRRWWNVRTPERYIEAVAAGAPTQAGDEELDTARRAEERFALAHRTRAGVAIDHAAPLALRDSLDELTGHGLIEPVGDRVVLTRRGRLLASDVTARLLLAHAATVGTRYH
jgi:oxygen-independent coproporphyrinogen-3 oxidase